jgi:hypothetical protein
MPTRQYLLQALPVALEALNLYSEAQHEGYVTPTRSAHAAVVRVRSGPVASIHLIADKAGSRKRLYTLSDAKAIGPVLRAEKWCQKACFGALGTSSVPSNQLR